MRYIDGGRDRFIEFVQMAVLNGSDVAERWMFVYADLLPSERKVVNFDDVCAGSGVAPKDLMAVVVSTAMEFGQDVANLVAAAIQGAVVQKMGESAMRITGKYVDVSQRDRIALLQSASVRFLPVPKGTVVHVTASANSQAAAAASAEPSVPTFAEDMAQLVPARQQVQRDIELDSPSFLDGVTVVRD